MWDVQMASFRELDKCDKGARSEERGGDFDFGFFFGESHSLRRRRRRVTMKKSFRRRVTYPHISIPPIHRGSGETNNTTPRMLFSVDKVLRDGLIFAGFTDVRITRCAEKRNTDRFNAHYGVCPKTVASFLEDFFHKHLSLKYKDVFMTLIVVVLLAYDIEHKF